MNTSFKLVTSWLLVCANISMLLTPSAAQTNARRYGPEIVPQIFSRFDLDKDGILTRDEASSRPGSLVNEYFDMWDRDSNGDGSLTREEITARLMAEPAVHGALANKTVLGAPDKSNPSTRSGDYPINELPMYGGLEKSPWQLKKDKTFIVEATMERSREQASVYSAQFGWKYYSEKDLSTAIKRFNQAWLLDPQNYLALWGFAIISVERHNLSDANKYFAMAAAAVKNGSDKPIILAQHAEQMVHLLSLDPDAESKEAMTQAANLFKQSSELAPLNGHQISVWAEVLFRLGEYELSREKVNLAKQIDGHAHEDLVKKLAASNDESSLGRTENH